MRFTDRHSIKCVVLACVVAILYYFRRTHFYSETTESESRSADVHVKQFGIYPDVNLHADVYRQEQRPKYRTRDLRWKQDTNVGYYNISARNPLFQNYTRYGDTGSRTIPDTEDPGIECGDVHHVAAANRCAFINATPDCDLGDGFIDYTHWVYCDFSPHLLPLAMVIVALWWLFLFVSLAVTADDFFCPALAVIADTMRLSHNIAGVTFLAFGNGAPDIFSAIAAIGNAKNGDAGLAIGALFGAGVFVTTVVAGTIAIVRPFDSMQRPFLRDVIFYIAALFWTFYVLWDKQITKYEAIGFILLYVLYVLVVVIGRYIYTRRVHRQQELTGQVTNDDERISRTVSVNDVAESRPLLRDPDIINISAVRNTDPKYEFLTHISPIDRESWPQMNVFKKMYNIFKIPIMFLLLVTVPVVNRELDRANWNRHLQCLQCILGPVFCVFATNAAMINLGGSFPVWGLTLVVGSGLASLVFFTSKNEYAPKYHAVFSYLGFAVAVIWIYSIANEIVNILQMMGLVLNISNAILGLTFLAWGNSIGDFIADTVMARQGFPRMGISACFGGPLFNTLLGIGIPFTIATIKQGHTYVLKITLEEVVLAAFLALSLISSLIIVPLCKFRMTRGWGIYLLILYAVFLIVAILTEVGVFHARIDAN